MEYSVAPRQIRLQNGSSLLILMLLMFVVVTAGVGLATFQLTHSKSLWVNFFANQAYYIAEGGIEDGIARSSKGNQTFTGSISDSNSNLIGKYETTVLDAATESIITSKGTLQRDSSYTATLKVTLEKSTGLVVDWRQL